MKSQTEVYRAKAKEYARLTIHTKSLRESRRCRKLAEMYWALALGEKPESVQSSKISEMLVETTVRTATSILPGGDNAEVAMAAFAKSWRRE